MPSLRDQHRRRSFYADPQAIKSLGLASRQRHMPAMCNDFGNRVPYDDYLRAFSHIKA